MISRSLCLTVMAAATAAAITACTSHDAAAAGTVDGAADSPAAVAPNPGYVVDSALPPEELLRRFRVGLRPVATLDSGAARSRDELMTRFASAVARRDTVALHRMSISRAEFAYLYFPSTQYTRPPYATPPDVLWQLMRARSESGMKRLVARVGGATTTVSGYDCAPAPSIEGENRFHQECTVSYRRSPADSVERRRLFGSIMERDGRYKFVSYANDF